MQTNHWVGWVFFLKGKYGEELLTIVGRDEDEQILTIAYVVVEVENTDSWTWFLQLGPHLINFASSLSIPLNKNKQS